jgi:hypothetical protein
MCRSWLVEAARKRAHVRQTPGEFVYVVLANNGSVSVNRAPLPG